MRNKIDDTFADLRKLFGTKNIYDESNAEDLTDEELNEIISIIKKKKVDGFYIISNRLELELNTGKVFLRDKEQENE